MRRSIQISDGNMEAKIEPSADVASKLWTTVTIEGRMGLDSARTLMELISFISAASYPLGLKIRLDCDLQPNDSEEERGT